MLGKGRSAPYVRPKLPLIMRVRQRTPTGHSMNPNYRNLALWAIIAVLLIALFNLFQTPQTAWSLDAKSPIRNSCRMSRRAVSRQ